MDVLYNAQYRSWNRWRRNFAACTSACTNPIIKPPKIAPPNDSKPPNKMAGNATSATVAKLTFTPEIIASKMPPSVATIPAIANKNNARTIAKMRLVSVRMSKLLNTASSVVTSSIHI